MSSFNSSGTVTIARSVVFDNEAGAGGQGGAGGSTSAVGVAGARTTHGGAGGPGGSDGGVSIGLATATVTNSTIARNLAGSGGAGGTGGLGDTTSTGGDGGNGGGPGGLEDSAGGSMQVVHATIYANKIGLGGAGARRAPAARRPPAAPAPTASLRTSPSRAVATS